MSATPISATPLLPPYLSQSLRRFGPLVLIIGLHVAFFWALQSGLLHQAVKAVVPKEIYVNLITEEPAPQPKPQPAEPKTVPVVQKQITRPTPKPVVTHTPTPAAITEEVTPPQESKQPPAEASTAPPAPAAPAQPAPPKLISGVSYINAPRPVYPPMDARMGNEGQVMLRVLISDKGRAEKVEIQKSSGSLRMDDSAREAVMRATFKPYIEDGKAIAVYAIIPINFTLNK